MLFKGLEFFTSRGVTSVQTNDSKVVGNVSNAFAFYERLLVNNQGKLPCRVFFTRDWKEIEAEVEAGEPSYMPRRW